MYLGSSDLSYEQLVAFVQGLEFGSPGLLSGFRELMILKVGDGANLGWPALVTRLVAPDAGGTLRPDEEQAAIDGLFDLLDEFLAETGVRGSWDIAREYVIWRQEQTWYDLDLDRYSCSPAPRMFELAEAAERLCVDRVRIFDLIASRNVRPSRVGAELYFSDRQVTQMEAVIRSASELDEQRD